MRVAFVSILLVAAATAHASSPPATAPVVPAAAAGAPAATAVRQVSQDSLLARQRAGDPKLVVLDVRTPEEYAAGHVPGAINVPHDQVEARLNQLEPLRNREVVVYCRTGKRAGVALGVLEKAGFRNLGHLEGDIVAWTEAGRPIEKR